MQTETVRGKGSLRALVVRSAHAFARARVRMHSFWRVRVRADISGVGACIGVVVSCTDVRACLKCIAHCRSTTAAVPSLIRRWFVAMMSAVTPFSLSECYSPAGSTARSSLPLQGAFSGAQEVSKAVPVAMPFPLMHQATAEMPHVNGLLVNGSLPGCDYDNEGVRIGDEHEDEEIPFGLPMGRDQYQGPIDMWEGEEDDEEHQFGDEHASHDGLEDAVGANDDAAGNSMTDIATGAHASAYLPSSPLQRSQLAVALQVRHSTSAQSRGKEAFAGVGGFSAQEFRKGGGKRGGGGGTDGVCKAKTAGTKAPAVAAAVRRIKAPHQEQYLPSVGDRVEVKMFAGEGKGLSASRRNRTRKSIRVERIVSVRFFNWCGKKKYRCG